VIAELWMQVRMRFFILFNASNPDKVKELHTNNLTTGRMLGILVNPEWKEMVRTLLTLTLTLTLTLALTLTQRDRGAVDAGLTNPNPDPNPNPIPNPDPA